MTFEIAIGTCSCIGMTGATLGGGIGPYSGLYGTIADSLQSIDFVSGAGELLTVSESQNADLFWGTKGAGFNFGIATSMTYKIYDATNGGQAMNADMIFLGSQNASLWGIAQSFVGNQPKEFTLTFGIGYNSTLEQVTLRPKPDEACFAASVSLMVDLARNHWELHIRRIHRGWQKTYKTIPRS